MIRLLAAYSCARICRRKTRQTQLLNSTTKRKQKITAAFAVRYVAGNRMQPAGGLARLRLSRSISFTVAARPGTLSPRAGCVLVAGINGAGRCVYGARVGRYTKTGTRKKRISPIQPRPFPLTAAASFAHCPSFPGYSPKARTKKTAICARVTIAAGQYFPPPQPSVMSRVAISSINP
jgi:hypothetical protein